MNDTATERSSVLVMHHDPLLHAGLVAALRQHTAFEILVGAADSLPLDRPSIDVVVTDYDHAVRLADPAARAAHRPLAAARILALTSNDREADIRRAIGAGVHGYLLLGGSLAELIEGVTAVARGARFLCHSVARRMADSLTQATLTTREIDVLRLVIAGESNKGVARHLHIQAGTVKSHMSAILAKLGATSRTQAAGIAATRGLVEARPHEAPSPLPAFGFAD